MYLIDTHAHLHDPEFFSDGEAEEALKSSVEAGVTKIVCIGTSLEDSKRAVEFANKHPKHCWASVGIHPHEATKLSDSQMDEHLKKLGELTKDSKVVAIGECGLDFYYNDKNQYLNAQEKLLRGQIEIALKNSLPLSFHVREAFEEFWPIFESYPGIRGVLHSFTDRAPHMQKAVEHGLFIGVNGISTFTNHIWQKEVFKQVSSQNIVVETDSPFLTPTPKRGTINTPENVIYITKFLAELRGEEEDLIAKVTTTNAENLFHI